MTNAEKFKEVFGVCATETWAMSEIAFLLWLNGEYNGEERKTGKWIRQGGIHNMYTRYSCSECGREIDMYYNFGNIPTDEDVINEFPYCHCGAKMEVDE